MFQMRSLILTMRDSAAVLLEAEALAADAFGRADFLFATGPLQGYKLCSWQQAGGLDKRAIPLFPKGYWRTHPLCGPRSVHRWYLRIDLGRAFARFVERIGIQSGTYLYHLPQRLGRQ